MGFSVHTGTELECHAPECIKRVGRMGTSKCIGAMSMYVFGIVVAASDETPIGRASATLQVQLPALYPEHRFQFLGRKDLKSEKDELLFQVLVAEVRDVTDDEVVSEMASPDLVQTLQNAVDGIVAAAKIRNVN